MQRIQTLSSGEIIKQDFARSVRPILFQTDIEEFQYATHGGTLFVVNYRGRPYGITCRHVFADFDRDLILITSDRELSKGDKPADIVTFFFVGKASASGVTGEDVEDLCVIIFADHITPAFFKGSAYIIDERTVGTSMRGHEVHVAGCLKDKSEIDPPHIRLGYADLQMHDAGPADFDPFLRQATALYANPGFSNVIGLSGAPVFDQSGNVLCGMVIRGGMKDSYCTLYFVDFFDILKALEAAHVRAPRLSYEKIPPTD